MRCEKPPHERVSGAPKINVPHVERKRQMQKFKQAIPTREQTPGFETDVVARASLWARAAGLKPVTAWLQFESNAERTIVSVVCEVKAKKAVACLEAAPHNKRVPKFMKRALPATSVIGICFPDYQVNFGETHSAVVVKRSKNECTVIFRTFIHGGYL